jgi:membrane-associated phospholipid phosphatase
MSASTGVDEASPYFVQVFGVMRRSFNGLVRPPSSPRRAEAAGRMRRHVVWLLAIGVVAVAGLMIFVDVREIVLMPRRGTASLWPARILTDFANDAYVLGALLLALVIVALVVPRSRENLRSRWLGVGTQIEYLFLAVLIPVLTGEVIKWVVGRGRPFVGGKADAFNFVPFNGTEAHFSFPSAHSITAFALAFAVSAIWPRTRLVMIVYAIVILLTRLVLLAHHPSDVVAGAVIGVAGAMAVRYWFAVRRLGFAISGDGEIVPLSRH